jgi:hypothetical protein
LKLASFEEKERLRTEMVERVAPLNETLKRVD